MCPPIQSKGLISPNLESCKTKLNTTEGSSISGSSSKRKRQGSQGAEDNNQCKAPAPFSYYSKAQPSAASTSPIKNRKSGQQAMMLTMSPDHLSSKASKVLKSFVQTKPVTQLLEGSASKVKVQNMPNTKGSFCSPIKLSQKMKRANSEQVFQIRGMTAADKEADKTAGGLQHHQDTLPSIHSKSTAIKAQMVKMAS